MLRTGGRGVIPLKLSPLHGHVCEEIQCLANKTWRVRSPFDNNASFVATNPQPVCHPKQCSVEALVLDGERGIRCIVDNLEFDTTLVHTDCNQHSIESGGVCNFTQQGHTCGSITCLEGVFQQKTPICSPNPCAVNELPWPPLPDQFNHAGVYANIAGMQKYIRNHYERRIL